MQHCSCMVFLGGDVYHGVWKDNVTVAEIALLRVIHGEDAITQIKPTFKANTKAVDELERLRLIYGPGNVTKEGKRLVDEVYPGRAPTLPVSFADIGVDLLDDAADEPATAPLPKNAKGSKASSALLGGGDGE